MNHNADLYGKITHPVEKILTEIPYTDGLNVSKLLNFINYLLQVKDLQQLSDWQILQVLLPKCKPPLKNRVMEALTSTFPVEELHSLIIKYFIPTGIYEEIKRKTVLRVQGNQERLAHYISDIRESSRLLRVDWNETQMVDTILIGLSPEERSRLSLINRPNTIADLEQCSIHSSNVWYSDQNRQAMKTAGTNKNELRALVPDGTTSHERQVFSRPHNVRKSGKLSVTPVSYTHLDVYKRQESV